jgi:hypothetical protein
MIALKAPFPGAGSYQEEPAREQIEQGILRMRDLGGEGNLNKRVRSGYLCCSGSTEPKLQRQSSAPWTTYSEEDALHFDTAELRFEEPPYTTVGFVAYIVFLLEAPASQLFQDHDDQIKPLAFLKKAILLLEHLIDRYYTERVKRKNTPRYTDDFMVPEPPPMVSIVKT